MATVGGNKEFTDDPVAGTFLVLLIISSFPREPWNLATVSGDKGFTDDTVAGIVLA